MRDDQVQRYARQLALPEIGGLGQTALLVAGARIELRDAEPTSELLAATYLAAGGVGTIVVANASEPQLADIAAHGPDTRVGVAAPPPSTSPGHRDVKLRELALAPRPAWWPSAPGDAVALAHFRACAAAAAWMLETARK